MKSDPTRIVAATEASETLSALLDGAVAGRAAHIARGEGREKQVVAHLLPADALVITADVEEALFGTVARVEAARLAGEIEKDGYHHAGTVISQILVWLWESGGDSAVHFVGRYAVELTDTLAVRRIARPPFNAFWAAMRIALRAECPEDEIGELESEVRSRLGEFTTLFSPGELTGDPRHRDADDPWPDTTATGRCFAKKRWSDVRVGDFVPSHREADLDYDDGWCRIEQLDADRAVLRDATGQHITSPIGDRTEWLPTRSREPWQWGLPQ